MDISQYLSRQAHAAHEAIRWTKPEFVFLDILFRWPSITEEGFHCLKPETIYEQAEDTTTEESTTCLNQGKHFTLWDL